MKDIQYWINERVKSFNCRIDGSKPNTHTLYHIIPLYTHNRALHSNNSSSVSTLKFKCIFKEESLEQTKFCRLRVYYTNSHALSEAAIKFTAPLRAFL